MITDLFLRQTAPQTVDLAALYPGASNFAIVSSDADAVTAQISGTDLTLTPGALGFADLTLSFDTADGPATDPFRAIVVGPNAYSFAVLPDTQSYTSSSDPEIQALFGNMVDYLVEQQDALAIQHVIHVGDITDFGSVAQWTIAEDAMERLDGEISYTLAVGNHDQQRPGFASAFSFESDVDTYFTPEQVGATAAQGGGLYDGFDVGPDTFGNGDSYANSIRNHYTTFTAPDGTDWLVLSLEFGAPDDVLRWASEVVEAHLDHRVIIDTHSWNGGDKRVDPTTEPLTGENDGWGYAIRENPRGINGGEDMWREFASKYPNVTFTFNGHNFLDGAETVVSQAAGDNDVHQIFVNYQNGISGEITGAGDPAEGGRGGNGAFRLVVIDPDNDRLTTHTKFTALDQFFERVDHQEVFEGVALGAPEEIALAKFGPDQVVQASGPTALVTIDPSASILPDGVGAKFRVIDDQGRVLGFSEGAPIEVTLPYGPNRLTLEAEDDNGNLSRDAGVVIVEAPGALLTETFDDGVLDGWSGVQPPGSFAALGTDLGLGLPSLGGVSQIPLTLRFDSSFRPYDNMTGEVLVSFDGGQSFSSLLTLDTSTVPGGTSSLSRSNEAVSLTLTAPSTAETATLAWRLFDADNDWWWAIDTIALTGAESVTLDTFWTEDFEGLAGALQPAADEDIPADLLGWTHTAPDGWTRSFTVDPADAPPGTTEWAGWSFTTPAFWLAADTQSRDSFTLGQGVIAVADSDEWSDGPFGTGSNLGGEMTTMLETLAIPLAGRADAGDADLRLSFDSSFRPYERQTGEVLVSFDGGASFESLLTLNTDTAGGASSLSRANEAVALDFTAPAGTEEVVFRFDYRDTDNDWWWAIDNLALAELTRDATVLLAEDFDGLADDLQPAVDENIPATTLGWTQTPPAGWQREVAPTTSQGTTEWQGWSFVTPEFWLSADGQSRDSFTLGQGVIAVADTDEWDDFNAGAAGNTDEFDTTLTTPGIALAPVGGGQQVTGIDAVGVAALAPDELLRFAPGVTATAENGDGSLIFDYTIALDLAVPEPAAGAFTPLWQTNIANPNDAEAYIQNFGSGTGGIGILGDYAGGFAYDSFQRVVATVARVDADTSLLAIYVDGALVNEVTVPSFRFSVAPEDGVLLLADPANFTTDAALASAAFVGGALSATEVAALGAFDGGAILPAGTANAAEIRVVGDAFVDRLGSSTVEITGAEEKLTFGDLASFGAVPADLLLTADELEAGVLSVEAPEPDEGILVTPAASGVLDEYTFVIDLYVAGGQSSFTALYQTDVTNAGDADIYIRGDGGIGISGNYQGAIEFDAWNRIALTFRLDGDTQILRKYIDGAFVGEQVVDSDITDGTRWSIDADAGFLLLTEPAGFTSDTAVNSLTLTPDVLTDAEIAALGGPDVAGPEGIPANPDAVQLNFDDALDSADFGAAEVELVTLGGDTSYLLKGSIFGNPNGEGTASLYQQSNGGNEILVYTGAGAEDWGDYVYDMVVEPADNDTIGAVFRWQDASTHYELAIDQQSNTRTLTRVVDGAATVLATEAGSYRHFAEQDLRISVIGGEITVTLDEEILFGGPVTDPEPIETGTVGVLSRFMDRVKIDHIAVNAPVLAAKISGDTRVADTDGDGSEILSLSAAGSVVADALASYTWYVGEAPVATGVEAEIAAPAGFSDIRLRIEDSAGAVAEAKVTAKVAEADRILLFEDFEGGPGAFRVVDEGTQNAPSDWQVTGGAYVQASGIGSSQQETGFGAWSLGGEGAYILRDGTYAVYDTPEAAGWTDLHLSTEITPVDGDGIGVLVRYQDPGNYLKLELDDTVGVVQLTRHEDGYETVLARGWTAYEPGETLELEVRLEGDLISTFVDGKPIFGTEVRDDTFKDGTIALYAWNQEGVAFDDVTVADLTFRGPERERIEGTDRSDRLVGTAADEILAPGAGRFDRAVGGEGSDVFEFGAETGNGSRETDWLLDFTPGLDAIDLGGAEIDRAFDLGETVLLRLAGDGDLVVVVGAGSLEEIDFL